MSGCLAKTTIHDDDVPPDLRPFIDILLNGDREAYSNSNPTICPKDLDKGESSSRMAGATGFDPGLLRNRQTSE